MKICIPTLTAGGKDANVSEHFGSSPFFTIYDSANGAITATENSNQHHAHGTCHPVSALGETKVDAVICRGMGARAVQGLRQAGIRVYYCDAGTAGEALKHFEEKTLTELSSEGSCGGHGCG